MAVVTGGSRGLGREMVLAFAQHGADVVIASRKLANCEAVADEVRSLGEGGHVVAVLGRATTDDHHVEFHRIALDVHSFLSMRS